MLNNMEILKFLLKESLKRGDLATVLRIRGEMRKIKTGAVEAPAFEKIS